MHDAAIASECKRLVRLCGHFSNGSMVSRGQSSDPNLPNFDVGGIPLVPGYIEQINEGDSLQEKQSILAIKL